MSSQPEGAYLVYNNTYTFEVEGLTERWRHKRYHTLNFNVESGAFVPKTKWVVDYRLEVQDDQPSSDWLDSDGEEWLVMPDQYTSIMSVNAEIKTKGMKHLAKYFLLASTFEIYGGPGKRSFRSRRKAAAPIVDKASYYDPSFYTDHVISKKTKQLPLREDNSLKFKVTVKLYLKNSLGKSPALLKDNAIGQFASLLDDLDGTGADVTLVANDGKEFKAHKLILIARSPVLKNMLTTQFEEGNSGVIQIKDLSSRVIKFLRHFIYKVELLPFVVDREDDEKPCISEVIYAADKYMLSDLKDYLDENIGGLYCPEKKEFFLRMTELFSLKKAKSDIAKLVEFMKKNPPDLDEDSNSEINFSP